MLTLFDPTVLEGKILNIQKILELDHDGQNLIRDLYSNLVWSTKGWDPAGIGKNGIGWEPIAFTQYYNTLNDHGYLITRRDKNLDELC